MEAFGMVLMILGLFLMVFNVGPSTQIGGIFFTLVGAALAFAPVPFAP